MSGWGRGRQPALPEPPTRLKASASAPEDAGSLWGPAWYSGAAVTCSSSWGTSLRPPQLLFQRRGGPAALVARAEGRGGCAAPTLTLPQGAGAGRKRTNEVHTAARSSPTPGALSALHALQAPPCCPVCGQKASAPIPQLCGDDRDAWVQVSSGGSGGGKTWCHRSCQVKRQMEAASYRKERASYARAKQAVYPLPGRSQRMLVGNAAKRSGEAAVAPNGSKSCSPDVSSRALAAQARPACRPAACAAPSRQQPAAAAGPQRAAGKRCCEAADARTRPRRPASPACSTLWPVLPPPGPSGGAAQRRAELRARRLGIRRGASA